MNLQVKGGKGRDMIEENYLLGFGIVEKCGVFQPVEDMEQLKFQTDMFRRVKS